MNAGSSSADTSEPAVKERYRHLQLVALALAGFPNGTSSDKDSGSSHLATSGVQLGSSPPSFWLDTCQNIINTIENPHLKASFKFLACKCRS